MSTYIMIDGGLGKECAFSALLPKLKERYGRVVVVSPYPQLFFGSPHTAGAHHPEDPFYDRVPRDADIIFREPYKSPYVFGKTHLCYEWARQLDVEWTPADKPQFFGLPQWSMEAANIRQQRIPSGSAGQEYILVQFAGGQSPYDANKPHVFRPGGQRRAYPLNMAQEFVNAFRKKFPNIGIVNYAMLNEEYFNLQGCITLNTAYWHYPYLLRSSLGFVAVDSSLHHMAAATDTPGVVIWGTTGPDMLGWEGQVNLSNTTRHEGRPLCHPFGDVKNADGSLWVDRDILSTAVPVKDLIDAIGDIIRTRRSERQKAGKKTTARECACGNNCKGGDGSVSQ
ncbi:MAG: hypothetical protein LUC51_00170 [Cloacibacillus porcorum]|nr:hypothetical protein [Cloacibacillus porcorum]